MIGIQPTQGSLNQQAGQILLSLRSDMYQVMSFNGYLQTLGQAGLVALGFTSDDAAALLEVFANVDAIRSMAMGAPYSGPSLPHNFLQDCTPLWGGN
jgi:hypothetical protein